MVQSKKKNIHYCIVGLGVTGISCLEFLSKNQSFHITATDTQDNFELRTLIKKYPKVNFFLGNLIIPEDVDFVVLSPGVDQNLPIINRAKAAGAKLTNDINLFLEKINIIKKSKEIRLVAVTGTNGKTTVVNILSNMATQCGIKHVMCGNVGNPALSTLSDQNISLYIMELSSFQLELINDLYCDVACILNITPDHLDRYTDFREYCSVKSKIYYNAKNIVYCEDDFNTFPHLYSQNKLLIHNTTSFGINIHENHNAFSVNYNHSWLVKAQKKILPIDQLSLLGEHNILNALACLAIGEILGFSYDNMIYVLRNFSGLEHRCQVVGKFNDGVLWINDSKGTNIGATIAALNNTDKAENKTIIILGGVSKNADLSILKPFIINCCKIVILIGQCKDQLLALLKDSINCYVAEDLCAAVNIAKQFAVSGDKVLLSPACASFDMFKDYKERGELFKKIVLESYSYNNIYESNIHDSD